MKKTSEEFEVMELLDKIGMQVYGRAGDELRCGCPFDDHRDTTPSFYVNIPNKLYNCFGCNRGGRLKDLAKIFNIETEVYDLSKLSFNIESKVDRMARSMWIKCNEAIRKIHAMLPMEHRLRNPSILIWDQWLLQYEAEVDRVFQELSYEQSSSVTTVTSMLMPLLNDLEEGLTSCRCCNFSKK